MSRVKQVQLKPSCILTVPIQNYENNFSFIVNGEEFNTSILTAELLSPNLCNIHLTDPTLNKFIINTEHRGNFSNILKLINFENNNVDEAEIPFYCEIIEQLGNQNIKIDIEEPEYEININNIIPNLQKHERYGIFYEKQLLKDIEFASSHFYELLETNNEHIINSITKITMNTIIKILKHDQLRLKTEDQLLKFINDLYIKDDKYSILYETVFFSNVSVESIKEFVSIFDFNYLTSGTWKEISKRLCETKTDTEIERYIEQSKKYEYSDDQQMKGIFYHIQAQTNGHIENEINFTSSSTCGSHYPQNVAIFDDTGKLFYSQNYQNSWICFDFKDSRIIPTHYTIRSYSWNANNIHPKSWVIEGSIDNSTWEILDKEENCSFLNGNCYIHTFKMNQPKSTKFKFIRMRSTGPNWSGSNYLAFEAFEIYGKII